MTPTLSGFAQLAYVTNDLDQAMKIFDEDYSIPYFHQLKSKFRARVGSSKA